MSGAGAAGASAGCCGAPSRRTSRSPKCIGAVARAGGLEYARERAQRLGQQADAELDLLPSSPARDALRASITYVLDRRS